VWHQSRRYSRENKACRPSVSSERISIRPRRGSSCNSRKTHLATQLIISRVLLQIPPYRRRPVGLLKLARAPAYAMCREFQEKSLCRRRSTCRVVNSSHMLALAWLARHSSPPYPEPRPRWMLVRRRHRLSIRPRNIRNHPIQASRSPGPGWRVK
jgi:hypothetical protein